MHTVSNLDEFARRLLPLTYFRRKAGEVLEKLPQVGTFILTKDGVPIAKLTTLKRSEYGKTRKARVKKLESLIGGFKFGRGLTPKELKKILNHRYEKMLP